MTLSGEARDEMTITSGDNSDMIENHRGQTVDAMLDFNLTQGKWITLCLPFDVSNEQAKAVMGDDVDIEELDYSTWNDTYGYLTLYFKPSETIVAGKPYVVKVPVTLVKPVFADVVISGDRPETITTAYCSMTGNYSATPLVAGDKSTLFIQNNTFYYPTTAGPLPATKCWFTLLGNARQAKGIGMSFEDVHPTGIKAIGAEGDNLEDNWYTPEGIRVNQPKQGVYIRNGKKYVIK